MPNKRDLKLDQYGISRHRYGELKNFCLQYNEWRDELKYNTTTVRSKVITDMPICHGGSNPMEALVEHRIELEHKCEMVEQSLIKAIGDTYNGDMEELYPRMLKSIVNDHINYAYLDEVCSIPCGCSKFKEIRRYFYFLLSQYKK